MRRRPCAWIGRHRGRCLRGFPLCQLANSEIARSAGPAGRRRFADRRFRAPGRCFGCRPGSSPRRRHRNGFPRLRLAPRVPSPGNRRRRYRAAIRAVHWPSAFAKSRRDRQRRAHRRYSRRTGRNRPGCPRPSDTETMRSNCGGEGRSDRSHIGAPPCRSAARSDSSPRACRPRDTRRSARCW